MIPRLEHKYEFRMLDHVRKEEYVYLCKGPPYAFTADMQK